MIAFAVSMMAFQLGISAVKAECPNLPPMQWATPADSRCTTGPSPVNKTCGFSCPVGYAVDEDHDRVYFQLVCQSNGTWSGEIHECVDIWPPDVYCPHDLTVVAKKGSPSEVVSWKVGVNDTSLSVDPNAKITVKSSHVSPYNFTIGRHLVTVTATDSAGNYRRCNFYVFIKDKELPSCSFCPSDIVKVAKDRYERLSWDRPICSDNSHLPPMINANYRSGQILKVPGIYKVQYVVKDFAFPKPNIYTGCSFTITLKMPKCRMFDSPDNGALVCLNRDADDSASLCQVACEHGTDFKFNPPMLYVCPYDGQWKTEVGRPISRLPWPNCSSGAGPSMQKLKGLTEFFFSGNQTHSEIFSQLKRNFMSLVTGMYVPPFYCKISPGRCRSEKLHVYIRKAV